MKDYTLNPDYPLTKDQNEGVDFLLSKYNALLAFQTGYGKTYMALTAAQTIMNKHSSVLTIITCPKSANSAFKKELKEKIGERFSIHTADEEVISEGARYHIFNYSKLGMLEKFLEDNKNVKKVLILDEAHALQSDTSKTSILMKRMRKEFTAVFALTATPILNDIEGLYNVAEFVKPGIFGKKWQFRSRYLITKARDVFRGGRTITFEEVVGYKNLDHLKAMVDTFALVRRKFYNLNFEYKNIKMTKEEEESYEIAAMGIMGIDEEEDAEAKDWAPRLHDLQRVVDGVHIERSEKELNSKEKILVETITDIIQRNEACLIYVEYEDTYNRLNSVIGNLKKEIGFKNLYMITGKVPYAERVKVEKNLGKRDIVILTKAGCQSLNLQSANNVVIYDIPFSVGWFIQVVGRVARMDSEYDVQNITLIEAKDTIDTYKRMLIQEHAVLIKTVFGAETNLPDKVSEVDRKFMQKLRNSLLWKFKKKRGR